MTNKITIIGAGMAGLLAANMLRRHDLSVLEKSSSLPENHSALLRFRSLSVSDATGIPFEKVTIDKGLWDGEKVVNSPTLAHTNAYSLNVTGGELHPRSIRDLSSDVRYVAPSDFVAQMAKHVPITFNSDVSRPRYDHPVISTIPMPVMMRLTDWPDAPEFNFKPIWTIKAQMLSPESKVYQTLYNVDASNWYRATLHGQELTLEFAFDPIQIPGNPENICEWAMECFSVRGATFTDAVIKHQKFGKITPISEEVRVAFILHLTDKWNIYSLGRFATWRPLLLDDLVKDIKHIEAMIRSGCNYTRRLTAY